MRARVGSQKIASTFSATILRLENHESTTLLTVIEVPVQVRVFEEVLR